MTISDEITKLNTNLTDSYTAVSNKGGTLPASENFDNLPNAINSITELKGETKTITPTTSQQTITPSSGKNGITQVTVNAVTSAIDSDIQAGNIKSGVSILGVNGTVTELKGETRSVSITSASGNTFTPTSGKNGITSITVTPTNQNRTVTPTTSQQTLTVNSGYSGNGTITVNAVTSSIDANITAGNIKNGVSILGITGNYTGTTPTGTLSITANGTYDVTNYASADVNVSGGSSGVTVDGVSTKYNYLIKKSGNTLTFENMQYWDGDITYTDMLGNETEINSLLSDNYKNDTEIVNVILGAIESIELSGALRSKFKSCTGLTSVDLSSLITVSGSSVMQSAFQDCTGLTGTLDLSSLTNVSGLSAMYYAFKSCTGLTSVDLSSLITVSGSRVMYYAFQGCTGLTSVDLSSLTTVNNDYAMQSAFQGCTGLTSVDLSSLTTVKNDYAMGAAFRGCTTLTTLSFPSLTSISFGARKNQFNSMLSGVTGCTVHFPSNLQSVIGSWLDVTKGFGGTNTTVLFDLPATT